MKRLIIPLFMVMLLVLPASLVGQTNFTTNIFVTDGTFIDTLTIGVNTGATYGIDSAFGETELPPVPPTGVFDARLIDIPNRITTPPDGHGQGLAVDVRYLEEDLQTDTFRIRFQPSVEKASVIKYGNILETENSASGITIFWDSDIQSLGGGGWILRNSLSTPAIDVDMTQQTSVDIDADEYSTVYILKGDFTKYRTLTMERIALDVDNKGKRGKPIKKKSNHVEFCFYVVNEEASTANDLHVEFKTPVDSASLSVSHFTVYNHDAKQTAGKQTKWEFSGGTVAPGESVMVCGYGVKDGTKEQVVSKWYWTIDNEILGSKNSGKVGINFTQNDIRLPMPNAVNVLEQMMIQAFPFKDCKLVMGIEKSIPGIGKDTLRFVEHYKYTDVLKTLIKDKGSKGYILHDTLASCLNFFDDAKKGPRQESKPILKKNKNACPG